MKKSIYAWAAVSALAMFYTGCGDDVITVKNEDYSIVDALSDSACTKDNEGALALVKGTGRMYACTNGEWKAVNAAEAVKMRCTYEPLSDSSGYEIMCDGESVGVVYNGAKGKDGKDGKDGKNGKGSDGKPGENGKSAFELAVEEGLVDTNVIKTEKEWIESLKGADGKDIFDLGVEKGIIDTSKFKTVEDWMNSLQGEAGSSCTAEPITETGTTKKYKIVCGADSVGVLYDGAAGDAGESCTTEEITEGENKGDFAVTCNGELKGVIKNGQKCAVSGDPYRNYETGDIEVTIACGDAKSVIKIPAGLNRNLEKVYNATVIFRFPLINEKNRFGKSKIDLRKPAATTMADLTVMELNSKAQQTGKNFVFDMASTANYSSTVVEDVVMNAGKKETVYSLVLQGDIEVTNLENPVVQLRMSLAYNAAIDDYNWSSPIVMNSIVKLKEQAKDADENAALDTVVIDFFTDYKAERVKTLIAGGKTFAEASPAANQELADALYLENVDEFERALKKTTSIEEYEAGKMWPSALIGLEYEEHVDFNSVYADFKKSFAKKGNLKNRVKVNFDDFYTKMYFVDVLALGFMQYMDQVDRMDASNALTVKTYKPLQDAFVDVYGLSSEGLKKDSYVSTAEKDGYFSLFKYYFRQQVWEPILIVESDEYNEVAEDVLGKCSEKGSTKSLALPQGHIAYCECNDNLKYQCKDELPCNEKNKGQIIETQVQQSGLVSASMACEETSTGYEWVIYYDDGLAAKFNRVCNEQNLYTVVDEEYYVDQYSSKVNYICDKTGEAPAVLYNWRYQVSSSENVVVTALNGKGGACVADNVGKTASLISISVYTNDYGSSIFSRDTSLYVCGAYKSSKASQATEYEWFPEANAADVECGACTQTVMNEPSLCVADEKRFSNGKIHTGMNSYKCDLVEQRKCVWNSDMAENVCESKWRYKWVVGNDLDLQLGTPCNDYRAANNYSEASYACIEKYNDDQPIPESEKHIWSNDAVAVCNNQFKNARAPLTACAARIHDECTQETCEAPFISFDCILPEGIVYNETTDNGTQTHTSAQCENNDGQYGWNWSWTPSATVPVVEAPVVEAPSQPE